jgi:hypothetical protein
MWVKTTTQFRASEDSKLLERTTTEHWHGTAECLQQDVRPLKRTADY